MEVGGRIMQEQLSKCVRAVSYFLEPKSVEQGSTQLGESNADMDVGSRAMQEHIAEMGKPHAAAVPIAHTIVVLH